MFGLADTTLVNKNIPKNAFDNFITTKQKNLISAHIQKITWVHKLSKHTTNVPAGDISEIQIFELILKQKKDISSILDIIDRFIPYPIIFNIFYLKESYISAAQKYPHPVNLNQSVVSWRFNTDWLNDSSKFKLSLKQNLDFVFTDFCFQISGNTATVENSDIQALIEKESKIKQLQNDIAKLEMSIKNCQQFNTKVELNLELKNKQSLLATLLP